MEPETSVNADQKVAGSNPTAGKSFFLLASVF